MCALLVFQVGYVISWVYVSKILSLSLVKLYLQYPIKILFIVIAREFGQKMHVQSSVLSTGALVVRGLGSNGVIIF